MVIVCIPVSVDGNAKRYEQLLVILSFFVEMLFVVLVKLDTIQLAGTGEKEIKFLHGYIYLACKQLVKQIHL